MTWGEFKQAIDRQLADAGGDAEVVESIDWSGLEKPVVTFEERRRHVVENFVRIT